MTTPFVGGLLSTITPFDVTVVHKSAVLQAVIVVKYRIPGPRWIWQSVKSKEIKEHKNIFNLSILQPLRDILQSFFAKEMIWCIAP